MMFVDDLMAALDRDDWTMIEGAIQATNVRDRAACTT